MTTWVLLVVYNNFTSKTLEISDKGASNEGCIGFPIKSEYNLRFLGNVRGSNPEKMLVCQDFTSSKSRNLRRKNGDLAFEK